MVHVQKGIERPGDDLVDKFKGMATATVYEAMGCRGAVSSSIRSIARGMKVCGPAVTVQFPGGDNLMLHKALAVAKQGDVIVAAQGDDVERAVWGEIMSVAARTRGIQGLVTDAYARDSQQIAEIGFPVFARGITVKGTSKTKLGWINYQISLTEVVVNPGDLVLGDDDGVVIIPRNEMEKVLEAVLSREAKEAQIRQKLQEGRLTLELLGLEQILKEKGLTEG